jgi:hypothetical protein
MSSSSLLRPDRRAALLSALLVASCGSLPAAAGPAGEQLDIVAVIASADRQVSLVADVRPAAATPIRSEDFSVTAGFVPLTTRAVPMLSEQPVIGLVVDASAADDTALQAGFGGAVNFLLQMPVAARTAVVADTTPPTVLAPLGMGATEAVRALSGVRVGGERATSDALTLVLGQLPVTRTGRRVVVLYTSGADAGGEAAAELVERLTKAHAVLAVVTSGTDTRYWSRITAATGGVLVAAEPPAIMAAFDDVAAALRARYLLTFRVPGELPTRVSVQVGTADGTLAAEAFVSPGLNGVARAERSRSTSEERGAGGVDLLWLLFLGVGAVVVIAAAARLRAWRARSRDAGGPDVTPRGPHELIDGATGPDETTERKVRIVPPDEVPRRAGGSETVGAEARTSPEGEASEPGMHVFDLSDPDAPREIAYYVGEAEASAGPSRGGDRPKPDTTTAGDARTVVHAPPEAAPGGTAEAAPTSRPTSKSPAASGAAAVAAAEQRARAVGAAARAAAKAASSSPLRRGSRPSGRPSGDAVESDRSD